MRLKWIHSSVITEDTFQIFLTFSYIFCFAGASIGYLLTMPVSGLLTKYGFDGGWASVFYCFGKCLYNFIIFYCSDTFNFLAAITDAKYSQGTLEYYCIDSLVTQVLGSVCIRLLDTQLISII